MAKIIIPIVTPSLNELINMHYHDKARLKKSYKAHIEGAVHDMGMKIERMKRPKKRTVKIYSFRKRECDRDNLIGGMKPFIDAIRELGLIWDDSPKYIDLNIFQLEDKYDPRTEVFIEEMK